MAREDRLTKNSQFSLVYSQGKTWASDLVVLKAVPNGLNSSRCGLVTSKRVGKAVVRNRVKRLMREIVRRTSAKPGWDLIFIARRQAATASYQQLQVAMEALLRRARLLEGEGQLGNQVGREQA